MTLKNIAKDRYVCLDGPLKGEEFLLASGFTLPLTIRGKSGQYQAEKPGSKDLVWWPASTYRYIK